VIGHEAIHGAEYFLLEHEKYGDEAAGVIVDSSGKVVCEDVQNGFDDLADCLPDKMSLAQQRTFIRDMNSCEAMTEHEEKIYSALIDLQAGRAIDAHEAEYGADGFRAFPESSAFEPEI
jgi:tRNA U54 and U55 pseudouridine synthase Pus10